MKVKLFVLTLILIILTMNLALAQEQYNFVLEWGSLGSGPGQFNRPGGIAFDNEYIYAVGRQNHRVQKFTTDGSFVLEWGSYGSGDGQFNQPYGIAVENGYAYIVDDFNHRVQKFTTDGAFITKWGSYGSGPGQFDNPKGIAVSGNYLYVCDHINNRIQKFTTNGNYVTEWGSYGSGDGQFYVPAHIIVNGSYVYVTDLRNDRVQKFTTDGSFVAKWGNSGAGDGQFDLPHGIAADSSGDIFVGCYNNRIQKFTPNGTFITKWGSTGSGPGQFDFPHGIAVDNDDYVYVADFVNDRIQKFQKTGGTNAGPNIAPSIAIVEPDGVNDNADTSYTITWTDSDPDDNAQISLYYDTDNSAYDGTLIINGLNEDADGANDSYIWNISAMPEGSYYIYAKINDGANSPVYDYSSGVVTIAHAPVGEKPEPPTKLHATAGRSVVNMNWKLSTSANVASYNIYRSLTSDFDIASDKLSGQVTGTANVYHDRNVEEDTIYYYKITAVSSDGTESKPSGEAWARPGTKQHNLLLLNNKFNPNKDEKVRVKFTVENESKVNIKIFNMKGTLVYEYPDLYLPAGEYEKQWAGINDNTDVVSSGVYAIQLFIDDELVDTKKVIVVK